MCIWIITVDKTHMDDHPYTLDMFIFQKKILFVAPKQFIWHEIYAYSCGLLCVYRQSFE